MREVALTLAKQFPVGEYLADYGIIADDGARYTLNDIKTALIQGLGDTKTAVHCNLDWTAFRFDLSKVDICLSVPSENI